jgi:hypothetical protein
MISSRVFGRRGRLPLKGTAMGQKSVGGHLPTFDLDWSGLVVIRVHGW